MPKVKALKTRNGGTMTEAQFYSKLSNCLRRTFRWWIPMKIALDRARRNSQSSNKRLKFEYCCAHCGNWFPRKDVQIDHIIPCGTLRSLEDIAEVIIKMTPETPDSFQVLCKPDHHAKTKAERLLLKSQQYDKLNRR